jgi:hypothetical protein
MKVFLILVGVLLALAGIVAGLYVGVWYCLVGGICALISACKAATVVPMDVALSIVRILCCSIAGWLSCVVLFFPGAALVTLGASKN